jgi:N-acetylmuramoyl-L-alanine amidase
MKHPCILSICLALLCLPAHPLWAKPASETPARPAFTKQPASRPAFIVAIDAGHGGKDGGAQGPDGILEKTVVLAIAQKLAALIRQEPGMRGVMVRGGDEFIGLHQRAEIARVASVDLFLSLHADAYEDGDARGFSVFTLSATGATSEAARCLADRENAGEVGGVDLKAQEAVLASVLVDLSKNANLEASDQAAATLLDALQQEFKVHNPVVQKAGFAVLKSLDVPSVLIETGFISNPAEAAKLVDSRHQDRLARAILQGIRRYARATPRFPNAPVIPPKP